MCITNIGEPHAVVQVSSSVEQGSLEQAKDLTAHLAQYVCAAKSL